MNFNYACFVLQALIYSHTVGRALRNALNGRDRAWRFPAHVLLDCLDAWVRIGLLYEVIKPDAEESKGSKNQKLTTDMISKIFTKAANALSSRVPGELSSAHYVGMLAGYAWRLHEQMF